MIRRGCRRRPLPWRTYHQEIGRDHILEPFHAGRELCVTGGGSLAMTRRSALTDCTKSAAAKPVVPSMHRVLIGMAAMSNSSTKASSRASSADERIGVLAFDEFMRLREKLGEYREYPEDVDDLGVRSGPPVPASHGGVA